jgi:hypothetical protein
MRLGALLPRAVLIALACILATAGFTLAADKTNIVGAPPATSTTPAQPPVLTVPAVSGQAFVFVKGILEDAGFGWRVEGPVHGYPANTVAAQSPAPGTRVIDTGAPMIVLHLARGQYAQKGIPEDTSSYPATPIKLAVARHAVVPKRRQPPVKPKTKAKKTAPAKKQPAARKKALAPRPPAFVVKGAPKEPLDEITLTARADRLARWIGRHPRHTSRNVRRWLYQHAWIVDGANFGWSHGKRALVKLIAVDRTVERIWGVGRRSEAVARAALARARRLSR